MEKVEIDLVETQNKLQKEFINIPEIKELYRSYNSLFRISHFPLDPRFNSILFIGDVYSVLRETFRCYSAMKASHMIYTKNVKEQDAPRHTAFLTNLEIGNILYRLFSIKDKLILAYASYFTYLEIEEKQDTDKLRDQLKVTLKDMDNVDPLYEGLNALIGLNGKYQWSYLENYRHMEVHRLDPKIDAYKDKDHYGWKYVKRISEKEAQDTAQKSYQGENIPEGLKERFARDYLEMQRAWDGFYYKLKRPVSVFDEYDKIQPEIEKCIFDLVYVANQISVGMVECEPFKALIAQKMGNSSSS